MLGKCYPLIHPLIVFLMLPTNRISYDRIQRMLVVNVVTGGNKVVFIEFDMSSIVYGMCILKTAGFCNLLRMFKIKSGFFLPEISIRLIHRLFNNVYFPSKRINW